MEEFRYDSRYDEFNRSRWSAKLETSLTEGHAGSLAKLVRQETRTRRWCGSALWGSLNLSY